MARFGSNINASLGAINYTPYLQGSLAGSQAIGQGIAALGKGIGGAIDKYQKTKEQEDLEKALGNSELVSLSNAIQQSTQKGNEALYSTAPKVDPKKLDDLRTRINSSNKAERTAAIAEVNSLNQAFKEAPTRALQSIQFRSAQNTLNLQEQEAKNTKAMTEAFTSTPKTKQTTVKVPELSVTSKAPTFTGLGEFMYGANKQESPAKTVINQAPAGAAAFLGENMNTGKYEYLTDRAFGVIGQQEQLVNQQRQKVLELEKSLKDGVPSKSYPLSSVPFSKTEMVQLEPTDRLNVSNQLYSEKKVLEDQTAQLNDLKKRASAAERFAGQPLTKEAGDPVLEKAANALAQFDRRVDVLKRNVEVAIKDREEKLDVPLTPDERLNEFMSSYIEKGGQVTPKLIGEMKRTFGADIEHFKFGDVEGMRFGDSVKIFDEKKPLSVAQLKYANEGKYNQLVSAAARVGLDRLSPEDRQVLVELNNRYGSEEADLVTGVRRKRMIQDIVRDRAVELGLTPRQTEFVPAPATPSKLGASRFGISVVK
jgi:hypothetical protein